MVECFPIASWARIDWEKVTNKIIIPNEDILNISSILFKQSLDLSTPVYLKVGLYKYPLVKASLATILESIEDIMDMGPDQYIYSPSSKYVIEFFHDDIITLGWI
jgi:hypothetical protein